jgi:hypothetical protein
MRVTGRSPPIGKIRAGFVVVMSMAATLGTDTGGSFQDE